MTKIRNNPLFNPAKNAKPNKDGDHERVRGDPSFSEIPEWLQEFTENLVDEEFLNLETHTRVLAMNPFKSR